MFVTMSRVQICGANSGHTTTGLWFRHRYTISQRRNKISRSAHCSLLHLFQMVIRLDDPQPEFSLPSIDDIPDDTDDQPEPGLPLVSLFLWSDALSIHFKIYLQPGIGSLDFPALVFGAASFSYQYNNDDHLVSFTPVRTIRLALRYAIDVY